MRNYAYVLVTTRFRLSIPVFLSCTQVPGQRVHTYTSSPTTIDSVCVCGGGGGGRGGSTARWVAWVAHTGRSLEAGSQIATGRSPGMGRLGASRVAGGGRHPHSFYSGGSRGHPTLASEPPGHTNRQRNIEVGSPHPTRP